MKRLLSLLLASVLFLSLSACAQSDPPGDTTAATSESMEVLGGSSGDIPISNEFQSLEELAYLKLLLDKDDADALKTYTFHIGRLALADTMLDLRDFFDAYGNVEMLFPRLDSGFSLAKALRFDIFLDKERLEALEFRYTQDGYSATVAIQHVFCTPPSRDPDVQLFIDGRAVDAYESIKENGDKYISIYSNLQDNPTYIGLSIPKDAEELPLEEILTFTTLNELLKGVTPLDPMIDATAEPTTEPT